VGRDAVQEELAETFPYFHLLAFSVVGECSRRIPAVVDTMPRVASMAASMASRARGT